MGLWLVSIPILLTHSLTYIIVFNSWLDELYRETLGTSYKLSPRRELVVSQQ